MIAIALIYLPTVSFGASSIQLNEYTYTAWITVAMNIILLIIIYICIIQPPEATDAQKAITASQAGTDEEEGDDSKAVEEVTSLWSGDMKPLVTTLWKCNLCTFLVQFSYWSFYRYLEFFAFVNFKAFFVNLIASETSNASKTGFLLAFAPVG